MSVIKISAKGIDELNAVYKKLKKDYFPTGSIKLNSQSLEYELELMKNELEGALKSICNKIIDIDELMDGESIFVAFDYDKLVQLVESDNTPVALKVLQKIWSDLPTSKKKACFQFLCDEKQIDTEKEMIEE